MDLNYKNKILITCAQDISPFLENEVKLLGFDIVSTHVTGVVIEARFIDTYKLNLELRTAFNVLFLLRSSAASPPTTFTAKPTSFSGRILFPKTNTFPWSHRFRILR